MKLISLLVTAFLLLTQTDPAPYLVFLPIVASVPNVKVTNATDVINGQTDNIHALIADPGPDGISFREAVHAANNTSGPKVISFSPSLKGATIIFGSGGITNEVLALTGGDLTIDGDIDGDGAPDITLDGSLGTSYPPISAGLVIWSSYNTIKNLQIVNFSTAIRTAVPEPVPALKTIKGNHIVKNVISGGSGIILSTIGTINSAEAYLVTDITIQDTLIEGNSIAVNYSGIVLNPSSGGASRNQIINTTIKENHLIQGIIGITLGVGDESSADQGVPGPTHFSDNNLIDQVTITNNVVENGHIGVDVFAGNRSNRGNQLQHALISSNTLHTDWLGIRIVASLDGGTERSTRDNAISDVVVDHNTIDGYEFGMLVGAGDWGPMSDSAQVAGIENSQLNGLQITNNSIQNFHTAGIRVYGGCANQGNLFSMNNSVNQLTVSGNSVINSNPGQTTSGIELLGGESIESSAQGNSFQGLVLSSNTVSGNGVGIWLVGGKGVGAQGNSITYQEMKDNILSGNATQVKFSNNLNGAINNVVNFQP